MYHLITDVLAALVGRPATPLDVDPLKLVGSSTVAVSSMGESMGERTKCRGTTERQQG